MLGNIVKGKTRRPRRVMLYGSHGIGKSTFGAGAPNPIFLATEDGQDDIGVDRTPMISDWDCFDRWLKDLVNSNHDYQTVVVDTVDWLEKLIFKKVAEDNHVDSIEKIGYGKGYVYAADNLDYLLGGFSALREKRKMGVIFLAHAKIAKVSPPDTDSYDRYEPDLHKQLSPILQEWCDEVLFATYEVNTIKREEGFNKERTLAKGDGRRIVQTTEIPTCLAKRRLPMPDQIELSWQAYQDCLKGDIDGIVVNGSSKRKEEISHV